MPIYTLRIANKMVSFLSFQVISCLPSFIYEKEEFSDESILTSTVPDNAEAIYNIWDVSPSSLNKEQIDAAIQKIEQKYDLYARFHKIKMACIAYLCNYIIETPRIIIKEWHVLFVTFMCNIFYASDKYILPDTSYCPHNTSATLFFYPFSYNLNVMLHCMNNILSTRGNYEQYIKYLVECMPVRYHSYIREMPSSHIIKVLKEFCLHDFRISKEYVELFEDTNHTGYLSFFSTVVLIDYLMFRMPVYGEIYREGRYYYLEVHVESSIIMNNYEKTGGLAFEFLFNSCSTNFRKSLAFISFDDCYSYEITKLLEFKGISGSTEGLFSDTGQSIFDLLKIFKKKFDRRRRYDNIPVLDEAIYQLLYNIPSIYEIHEENVLKPLYNMLYWIYLFNKFDITRPEKIVVADLLSNSYILISMQHVLSAIEIHSVKPTRKIYCMMVRLLHYQRFMCRFVLSDNGAVDVNTLFKFLKKAYHCHIDLHKQHLLEVRIFENPYLWRNNIRHMVLCAILDKTLQNSFIKNRMFYNPFLDVYLQIYILKYDIPRFNDSDDVDMFYEEIKNLSEQY